MPPSETGRPTLVDAETLARELGVSRDYVYAHKELLGAFALGTGPKARLRFDPDEARRRLAQAAQPEPPTPSPPVKRRTPKRPVSQVELLPIRGARPA